MIKCNVTVCGVIGRDASVRKNKEEKEFLVFPLRGEPPDEDEDGEADFDTVGGLIIDRLGRIPAAGEDVTLEYGGLEFTVLEVEDRRVGKVKCTRAPELNPENDDDEEEDA